MIFKVHELIKGSEKRVKQLDGCMHMCGIMHGEVRMEDMRLDLGKNRE
jgi:hypothetical protein